VGQGLEVWVGTADCTTDMARGKMGQLPVCWKVAQIGGMNAQTTISTQVDVRMQNIVGPQGSQPNGILVNEGSSACYAQQSYSSVQFTIAFVPVSATGLLSGTGATFSVNTDLVGPPAPTGIGSNNGETLMVLTWTPNVDPDTAGYDIYVAPKLQLLSSGGDGGYTLVCTEAGASSSSSSGGGSDAALDTGTTLVQDSSVDDGASEASSDAAIADSTVSDSATAAEASGGSGASGGTVCTNMGNVQTPGCGGVIFSQSVLSDGGGSVTVAVADDAGEDASTTIAATGGGISQIPTKYLVNANGTTTVTVSSSSVGSYNITGLTNNTEYVAVVAAVDGFGNIGPASVQQCDTPQPVNDFYKVFRLDGGTAGGGFCTLEAVGAPTGASIMSMVFGALGFGLYRRRRQRRG
jgi:hypothetical protein